MSSIHHPIAQRGTVRATAVTVVLATLIAMFGASTLFGGTAQAFSHLFTAAPANTAVLTQ
ncbi:MAG: hypothetical protein H0X24_24385, partial [Ktedonobacterales bacterium]|nr:hypothetical protein [Ktedonobacterales bacterium]